MTDRPLSKRRIQTRLRLAEAAAGLFAERGISASSVEQICERAGFTRGAFYSNFASKEDLCLQVLELQRQMQAGWITAALQAIDEHVRAHPEILELPPDERVRIVCLMAFTAPGDTRQERAQRLAGDPWAVTALVPIELALHAVREPAVREGYLIGQEQILAGLATFAGDLLELVGLRLLAPSQQVARALLAVILAVSRRAFTAERDPGEPVGARVATVLICASTP